MVTTLAEIHKAISESMSSEWVFELDEFKEAINKAREKLIREWYDKANDKVS